MSEPAYREAIVRYIRENANPPDKFSHQERLYRLATQLAREESRPFDDDILFAAAWLHDLGVFIGHRPENPVELAKWDNVAYAARQAPVLLAEFDFPEEKVASVVEVIQSHLPSANPQSHEGKLLRDADILEQLGAVGILRTVSKVGRDTRFLRFSDALRVLKANLEQLPNQLHLESSRRLAGQRLKLLEAFIEGAQVEAGGVEF